MFCRDNSFPGSNEHNLLLQTHLDKEVLEKDDKTLALIHMEFICNWKKLLYSIPYTYGEISILGFHSSLHSP